MTASDAILLVKLAPRWAAETGRTPAEIARELSEWFSTPSPEWAAALAADADRAEARAAKAAARVAADPGAAREATAAADLARRARAWATKTMARAAAPAEPTPEEAWVAASSLESEPKARQYRVRRADLASYFTWLAAASPTPPARGRSLSDTIRRLQAQRRAAARPRATPAPPWLGPDDPDALYNPEHVRLARGWLRREVEAAGWAVPRFLKAGADALRLVELVRRLAEARGVEPGVAGAELARAIEAWPTEPTPEEAWVATALGAPQRTRVAHTIVDAKTGEVGTREIALRVRRQDLARAAAGAAEVFLEVPPDIDYLAGRTQSTTLYVARAWTDRVLEHAGIPGLTAPLGGEEAGLADPWSAGSATTAEAPVGPPQPRSILEQQIGTILAAIRAEGWNPLAIPYGGKAKLRAKLAPLSGPGIMTDSAFIRAWKKAVNDQQIAMAHVERFRHAHRS